MFKKQHYRFQVDFKDCGVACLAMILAYYGSDYSLAFLRNLTKTNLNGTTAYGLVKAGEKLDLLCRPLQLDRKALEEEVAKQPALVHVVKEGKILHYYVVYKLEEDWVFLADPDPQVGLVKRSWEDFGQEWTGVALFFEPGEDYQVQEQRGVRFYSLFRLLLAESKLFATIVCVSLLLTVLTILSSYGLQWIVDGLLPQGLLNQIQQVTGLLFLAAVLQAFLQFCKNYPLVVLSRRLSLRLLEDYLTHVFHLPLSFFATRRSGEILSRFTDANQIIEALSALGLTLLLEGLTLVFVSFALAFQSGELFLLSLLLLPLYTLLFFLFRKKFKRYHQEQLEAGSRLSSNLMDHIKGMETLKALGVEELALAQDKDYLLYFWDKVCRFSWTEQLQAALKTLLQLSTSLLLFWLGAGLIVAGRFTLGQLLTFSSLLGYYTGPLENLLQIQTQIQKAQVAFGRLQEVYQVPVELGEGQVSLPEHRQGLVCQEVNFAYDYGPPLLENLTFELPFGSKVALVGNSGSGKSSLAKLLVGFYPPLEGRILVDGQDFTQIAASELRRRIHYLAQDASLFQGTVRENLLWACSQELAEVEIWGLLNLMGAGDFVKQLPLGLETRLGTDGTALSTGQVQRLALARALLTGADYLILDEATSHLDPHLEFQVVQNLLTLDKTLIFITHNRELASQLDQVWELERGKIRQWGG